MTFEQFKALALARCSESVDEGAQAGASTDYAPASVRADCLFAIDEAVSRVSAEHLTGVLRRARTVPLASVSGQDLTNGRPKSGIALATLMTGAAETDAVPWVVQGTVAVREAGATGGQALYGVLSLPPDAARLAALALPTWRRAATALLPMSEGPGAAVTATRSTLEQPAAFYGTHGWDIAYNDGAVFVSLGPALLHSAFVAPCGSLTDVEGARLDYVPTAESQPDLMTEGLPSALVDASASLAAARLLMQDPETQGMAQAWEARASRSLQAMRPVVRRVSRRRGTYY